MRYVKYWASTFGGPFFSDFIGDEFYTIIGGTGFDDFETFDLITI